jgi:uncharacterized membrane protein HdeD (DUF308 family)
VIILTPIVLLVGIFLAVSKFKERKRPKPDSKWRWIQLGGLGLALLPPMMYPYTEHGPGFAAMTVAFWVGVGLVVPGGSAGRRLTRRPR